MEPALHVPPTALNLFSSEVKYIKCVQTMESHSGIVPMRILNPLR